MSFEVLAPSAGVARAWARWAWDSLADLDAERPSGAPPLDVLSQYRLEALVYAGLSRAGDPARAPLAAAARETAAINLMRPAALRGVLERFSDARIPHALYKGAAVTAQFAELRPVRPTSDADVLVYPADFTRARELLLSLGFTEINSPEPVSIFWNNERTYYRTSPIELHIDLHSGLHRRPLFAELAQTVVRSAVQVDGLWVATPELAPLLIAAHRSKHGFTGDPRELLDFRVVIERIDPGAVLALPARAAELEVLGGLYAVWTLVRWWWGHGGATEERAYSALCSCVGSWRPLLDRLAALDSPFVNDKPWARAPFLKMYLPMPLLTGRPFVPLALGIGHLGLRALDVVVGGPDVVGHFPEGLRVPAQALRRLVGLK